MFIRKSICFLVSDRAPGTFSVHNYVFCSQYRTSILSRRKKRKRRSKRIRPRRDFRPTSIRNPSGKTPPRHPPTPVSAFSQSHFYNKSQQFWVTKSAKRRRPGAEFWLRRPVTAKLYKPATLLSVKIPDFLLYESCLACQALQFLSWPIFA